jgi:TrmH family RNA methyltransferase
LLSQIKIVLVETSHPGNIGAVARAMKTMGVCNLALVNPKVFPSAEATARAAGADSILANAVVTHSLSDAIADCQIIFGASARRRTISWPELTPRQCADKVFGDYQGNKIAIVFGRENSGLNNDELDQCHFLVRIPCNQVFSSLNLAAAVQVVCYELFVASGIEMNSRVGDQGDMPLASAEQMESFYEHLQQTLIDIGFMQTNQTKSIMRRLRRIYNRLYPDTKELDILRGILRMSQGYKRNQ